MRKQANYDTELSENPCMERPLQTTKKRMSERGVKTAMAARAPW